MYHILTHPPTSNYGGILQAYALQCALQKVGYSADIIDYTSRSRIADRPKGLRRRITAFLVFLSVLFGVGKRLVPSSFVPLFHRAFKKRWMHLFPVNDDRSNLPQLCDNAAFIVGSDQVWRGLYARTIESLPFMFLNFATPEQRRLSIAYSASFGSDTWEGSPEETAQCTQLLREFKAVSVREHSGIKICRDIFGVDAVQMPDPTLLLEQDDYNQLTRECRIRTERKPFIATYLLDIDAGKKMLTQQLSQEMNLGIQSLLPVGGARKLINRVPLSIPQWLCFMRDCECFLTDSFHGCVFAIIFNKPFVCLGNVARGAARFDSLLGTFGLQDRLITEPSAEKIAAVMNTPIDWSRVNNIRKSEQTRAFQFIKESLGAN